MTQEEFSNLLGQLEEMALLGKKPDINAVLAELGQIQNRINDYQGRLADLKTISEDSYVSERKRLDDQSKVIKTKEDIIKLKSALKELQSKIDSEISKEKSQSQSIDEIKKSLTISTDGLLSMQTRSEKVSDEIKSRYKEQISTLEATINDLKTNLEELDAEYSKTQTVIEELVKEREQIERTIATENSNLEELQATIEDGNAYIDKKRKQDDEKAIYDYEKEIAELESRKSEIVNNPSLIAHQAMEAFINGDNLTALKKLESIKEIAIANNPYINEPNRESLKDALTGAIEERDNFYQEIKERKYTDGNTVAIDERMDYLEKTIGIWKEEITEKNAKISALDNDEVYKISDRLAKIHEDIARITKELKECESLLEGTNEEDISKKAEIQAAYDKKADKLSRLEKLRDAYNRDFSDSIKEISKLEEYNQSVQEKIARAESEKQELSKEKALNSGTKDIIAKQADENELQKLVNNVMLLKHALKYKEPISAVYKKVETGLGLTMTSNVQTEEVKNEVQTAPLEETKQAVLQTDTEETKEEPVKVESVEPTKEVTEVKEEAASVEQPTVQEVPEVTNIASESTSPEIEIVENIEPQPEVQEESKSSEIVFEPVSFDKINTTNESPNEPQQEMSRVDINKSSESLAANNQMPITEAVQPLEAESKVATKVVEQAPVSVDNTHHESLNDVPSVSNEAVQKPQEQEGTIDLSDFFKQLYEQPEIEESEKTSLGLGA